MIKSKAIFCCYAGTLMLAFNPLFAKWIQLSATIIIFWRCLIAAVVMTAFNKTQSMTSTVQKKDRLGFIVMGLCLAIHFVSFFVAVKTSTVALGMIALFTFPAMIVILEPLMRRERLAPSKLVIALLLIVAIMIVMPEFSWKNTMTQGLCWGLGSALFCAVRNILTRRYSEVYSITHIMQWQLSVSAVALFPVVIMTQGWLMSGTDILLIACLGIICTAIAHTLFASSFKHLSAAGASIIAAIQPALGVILGVIFLGEIPANQTVIGGIMIIALVMLETWMQLKKKWEGSSA